MNTLEALSKNSNYYGLNRQQLLDPGAEVDTPFTIWYGPEMEHEEEGVWGMVPRWTPSSRFKEVSLKRRFIEVEKLTIAPSCSEENGASRGVIRCEGALFQPYSKRVMIKAGTDHWSPVVFNRYYNRDSKQELLTFSVVTRQVSSYDLSLDHPLQVPIELPDPLAWVDPKLSKFKIESFIEELLRY